MDDVKSGLRYAFQTSNALTLALPATGHSGMEAVMDNFLEQEDAVLVASNGIWGQRAADMANRKGERALLAEEDKRSILKTVGLKERIHF